MHPLAHSNRHLRRPGWRWPYGRVADALALTVAVLVGNSPPAVARIGVEAMTDDDRWTGVINWAEEAFAIHGLELPDLVVQLTSNVEQCHGRPGLYSPAPRRSVTICVPHNPAPNMVRSSRMLISHEFAHVWGHANLDSDRCEQFMDLHQLDNWNDSQRPHGARGIEQAADVIARGIVHGPEASGRGVCGYEALTGRPAPSGVTEDCASAIS